MSLGSSGSTAVLCARFFSSVRLRLAAASSVQPITKNQSRFFSSNIEPARSRDHVCKHLKSTSNQSTSIAPHLVSNNAVVSSSSTLQHLYRDAVRRFSTSSALPARESTLTRRRHASRLSYDRSPFQSSPPPLSGRNSSQWLLWTLMGLNAIVFCGWAYGQECLKKYRDPRILFFMSDNFLSGIHNLREGRYWTIVTSCISHSSLTHFALNMISFAFMAPPVLALVGPSTFLGLYVGAGAVCSLVSIGWKMYVNPWLHKDDPIQKQIDSGQRRDVMSLGASGSVYAIMTTFALLSPHTQFLIFFVLPIPAWIAVPGVFAWDLSSSIGNPRSGTDSPGHIGGILAGFLFWRFRLRGRRFY